MKVAIATFMVGIGLLVAVFIADSKATTGGMPAKGVVARVHGCPSEDSCTIDYTHRGVWVIRRVQP